MDIDIECATDLLIILGSNFPTEVVTENRGNPKY